MANMPNTHVKSGMWAGALTVIVAAASIFVRDTSAASLGDLLIQAFTPGFYLAIFMGFTGGPDGLPNFLLVIALTFLILWAAIDHCSSGVAVDTLGRKFRLTHYLPDEFTSAPS